MWVEHKLFLYADDPLLFVTNLDTPLHPLMSLLKQFGQISGYKLNLNKSELFPIGETALALDYTNLPFKIVDNHFTYLGITVTRKQISLQRNLCLIKLSSVLHSGHPCPQLSWAKLIQSKSPFSQNFCISFSPYQQSSQNPSLNH